MGSYKWVIIRVTRLISHIRGPITPFITTHEPPSTALIEPQGSLFRSLLESLDSKILCTFSDLSAPSLNGWSFMQDPVGAFGRGVLGFESL